VLSLAQAVDRRGAAGEPLPGQYASLVSKGAQVCKGQVCLVAGPPSAGKSLLIFNMLIKMGVPTLAFLLDGDELTASARFASIITGDPFLKIRDDIDTYRAYLAAKASHIQAVFHAADEKDIALQLAAYEQRFGMPPECIVLDNIGNISAGFENEWPVVKAMILELDTIAKKNQLAVIATHHMTDIETTTPLPRSKLLGKGSQFPRCIMSVAFDPYNGEFKVAVVKASSGPSDTKALHPITFYSDPAKMELSEYKPAPAGDRPWGY
jgi:hypothetical protein